MLDIFKYCVSLKTNGTERSFAQLVLPIPPHLIVSYGDIWKTEYVELSLQT